MRRGSSRLGDGDACPLFPRHGNMFVIPGTNPAKQWCPDQSHEGTWRGENRMPPSRAKWPLYGFEEAVASYLARLDRAVSQAALPDLSNLEV